MTPPEWLLDENTAHLHHRPARAGSPAEWPDWVSDRVRAALHRRGIERPWAHQAIAADAAFRGRHVAIATGTASGKSLAYLLPVLAAGLDGRLGAPAPDTGRARSALRLDLPPRHTALYLAPTKALAHDQASSLYKQIKPFAQVTIPHINDDAVFCLSSNTFTQYGTQRRLVCHLLIDALRLD